MRSIHQKFSGFFTVVKYSLVAVVFSAVLSGCMMHHDKEPVAVDMGGMSKEKMSSEVTSIPYCCTSKKRKLACHAYNCGDSTRGCVKWCANN